jgi:hypothetical protein
MMAKAYKTAAGSLLVGWLLLEAGLGLIRPRLPIQVAARVPMYFYIVVMSLLLFAAFLLNALCMRS